MPTRWTAKTWTLVAAVLGSSVVFLDYSVLSVALPAIGREPRLFVDVLEGQNYIQYGYLLTLSAFLVLAGALSDYYGRKRVFVIGLIGFAVTSLLCAIAPNVEFLIVARLFQGASGAVLVPGSLAVLTTNFEGAEQGRAFGVWAASTALAPIVGPFIGGVLVDTLSWRWIFLLNLPLVAVATWAALRYMKESRDDQANGRFDWLGALLVALAVGGLSFGAIYGQQRQWQDPIAFVALGVGTLATVGLPLYFRWARNPLVPLSLFRSRNFSVTNVSTLLIYGALYVLLFFQVLFMQGTLGYSATATGLSQIPGPLFLVLLSTRFGAWAAKAGPRWFMTFGPLLMALAILWLVRIPSNSAPWLFDVADPATYLPSTGYLVDILPSQLVFGLGLSMMVAPLTTALMRSVSERVSGLASAINNAISRVGPQLAGALIFVVISIAFYNSLHALAPSLDVDSPQVRREYQPLNPAPATADQAVVTAVRSASTDAFHLAMLVSAGLLLAGAAVNGAFISNRQALAGAEGGEGSLEETPTPSGA
ncbi:MAG TPA: MFS transporter [Candidatus Limnocylindrales bacterium]